MPQTLWYSTWNQALLHVKMLSMGLSSRRYLDNFLIMNRQGMVSTPTHYHATDSRWSSTWIRSLFTAVMLDRKIISDDLRWLISGTASTVSMVSTSDDRDLLYFQLLSPDPLSPHNFRGGVGIYNSLWIRYEAEAWNRWCCKLCQYRSNIFNNCCKYWCCIARWCRFQPLSGDAKGVKIRDAANRLHVASSWSKHDMDPLVFIIA